MSRKWLPVVLIWLVLVPLCWCWPLFMPCYSLIHAQDGTPTGVPGTDRGGLVIGAPHCWHASVGSAHETAYWQTETCCWCGARRNVTYVTTHDPCHGPCVDVRATVGVVVTGTLGPCCSTFQEALPEPPAWCGSNTRGAK
jgi:hypothetical protein